MSMKTRNVQLSVKAVGNTGEFEGYASVFDVVDSYNDVVVAGAFMESLTDHASKGTMPALLWQHKADEPIGKWLEMKEDERGLYCRGQLLIEDDPLAKRAYAHLKAKSVSGLSIGYALKKWAYDEDHGVLELLEIDLWETSIVTFPANEQARVDEVKTRRDLETLLRATGCCSQKEAKLVASSFDPKPQWDVVGELEKLNAIIRS